MHQRVPDDHRDHSKTQKIIYKIITKSKKLAAKRQGKFSIMAVLIDSIIIVKESDGMKKKIEK